MTLERGRTSPARKPKNDDPMLDFYQADFPNFDLSRLTQKQLNVVVMRYIGGLSWRRMAQFEGVKQVSIRNRHELAMKKLMRQF